jgi:hypothetical protein
MKQSLKKTITGFLVASCMTMGAFASGQSDVVTPSGNAGTVTQAYESVYDIMVKGISNFTILQGDDTSITVNGDQAFIDTLDLTNNDGFLNINGEDAGELNVVFTTPSFSTLSLNNVNNGEMSGFQTKSDVLIMLSGETDLAMNDTLNAPSVRITASSKSKVMGEVGTSLLDVRTSGSSEVTLKGNTDLFNVTMSNNSTGNFDGLHIQKAEVFARNDASISAAFPGISMVNVLTANDSSVNLAMNGVLKAYAKGDSSLTYSGDIRWIGQDSDEDASISAN